MTDKKANEPEKHKYRLELSFLGTNYHGWQRQPGLASVQQELEEALSKLLKQEIRVHACGRTDAGVHASQFFVDFYSNVEIDFDCCFRLNKILSSNIAVQNIQAIPLQANVQNDAISRTYIYSIHFIKDPFLQLVSAWYSADDLQLESLWQTAELIQNAQDFRSFCKRPELYKSTVRKVSFCAWKKEEQGLTFTITANGFLQGMVRLLVGAQLEVGYGKLSLENFRRNLLEQEPLRFYNYAYPQGLRLAGVEY